MLTNWEEIYRKVYTEYMHDDVELCGAFFDFEVSAPKSELLRAYAELQEAINGDKVIQLHKPTELPDLRDRGATTHVSGFMSEDDDNSMSEVYTGNMKDFLESLSGQEHETGWYRLSDYGERYTGVATFCCGVKQCFVL